MANDLAKKLRIRPGQKLLLLSAPVGYAEQLQPLPEGTVLAEKPDGGKHDFVHLFAENIAELEQYGPKAIGTLADGGFLWISYPKGTSKIKTDLNRDRGWDAISGAGFEGVSLIAIDDTWSAMRFRPVGESKSSRMRFREREIAEWGAFLLNSRFGREWVRLVATGIAGNMPKINGASLRRMWVPLPPQETKTTLLRRALEARNRVDTVAGSTKDQMLALQSFEENVLRHAFTGRL